jgi:multiple sugar transport system ATP-binding protein
MNLITADVTVDGDRVHLGFGHHHLAVPTAALDRYPGVRVRGGSQVIVGIRPEHFAMEGDVDVPDEQMITLTTLLAEAMGAEVHIHATVDVAPPSIEGLDLAADDADHLAGTGTKVIARVDGIHSVAMGDEVRLAVKMHLAHFFDPDSGAPLR